jgi:acetyltransferase-like isoleucine patch superfamily enzyme
LRKSLRHVGTNVILRDVVVAVPKRVSIGDHIHIGPGTQLQGLSEITIENYTIIGPEVYLLSSLHNFNDQLAHMVPYDEVELLKPVRIKLACWIGVRAMIMSGVTLGEGCIVGAWAVVTKSWPAGSILAGVPATFIRCRDMRHFYGCCERRQFYMLQKSLCNLKKPEVEVQELSAAKTPLYEATPVHHPNIKAD